MVFRTPVIGTNGIVVTAHPLATASALKILMDGGNAFDAAIAASSVLSVVLPSQNGLGGDLFALINRDGKINAINASGYAGSNLIYLEGLKEMPPVGPLTITVPGLVYGWYLLSKYASMDLKNLIKDAIDYARYGFPMSLHLVEQIRMNEGKIIRDPFLREKFYDAYLGKKVRIEKLARTLELIGEDPLSFYNGDLGERLGTFLEERKSLITKEDIKKFSGYIDDPVWTDYRGFRVYETPPNSQGAVALIMLKYLEEFDLSNMEEHEIIDKIIEAKIHAFSIRDKYFTDKRFMQIDVHKILNEKIPNDGDTVYFNVMDKFGNGVSCIQSIYHPFGSGVADPETGIIFQNRGAYFSLEEKHINKIEPRKRTLHTLMAGMATSGPRNIIFGAAGAEGQPQTHVQVLVNIIDRNMNAQEAVEYPRFIHGRYIDDNDDSIKMEIRFKPETIEKLMKKYKIKILDSLSDVMGDANVIIKNETFVGGADPRRDSMGLGF